MKVSVRLFASLRTGRFDETEAELRMGTTVAEVLESFNVPRAEVAIIFVNSRHVDFDTVLKEGDSLGLFPPIGGG